MDPVVTETVIKLNGSMMQCVNVHFVPEPNIFANALMKIMGMGAVLLSNQVTLLPSIFSERFYRNCVVRVLARQQLKKPQNIQDICNTLPHPLLFFKILTERNTTDIFKVFLLFPSA